MGRVSEPGIQLMQGILNAALETLIRTLRSGAQLRDFESDVNGKERKNKRS